MQMLTKFHLLRSWTLILSLLLVTGCGDLFDNEDASSGSNGSGGNAVADNDGDDGEFGPDNGAPSAGCTGGIECPGGASCGMAVPCEGGETNIFAGYAWFGAFVGGGSLAIDNSTRYQLVSSTGSTLLQGDTRVGGPYELRVGFVAR